MERALHDEKIAFLTLLRGDCDNPERPTSASRTRTERNHQRVIA